LADLAALLLEAIGVCSYEGRSGFPPSVTVSDKPDQKKLVRRRAKEGTYLSSKEDPTRFLAGLRN
jgi:hypothetical protein